MNYNNRVLILFAHPALQKSRVNRVLIEDVKDLGGVKFHDLYRAYPEFDINVSSEQDLLESYDVIVFQHPFFWYSTPAIIKEYLDLVLEHNWAYGSKGQALHGKCVMHVITTGGRESSYSKDGLNRYTIREFLRPLEQTATLCGMHFLPPFLVHGTHQMEAMSIKKYSKDYLQLIIALRDGLINASFSTPNTCINKALESIIAQGQGEKYAG